MIERVSDDDRPFDIIVVHSFSRFFAMLSGLRFTFAGAPKQACGRCRLRRN
jgi:histidinol-phosphate/aromatic aminotransferase/cobyric acid decarboxylase-like protein